jgi:hypothetical protein
VAAVLVAVGAAKDQHREQCDRRAGNDDHWKGDEGDLR